MLLVAALTACSGGGSEGPLAAQEYCEVTAGFFCDFYLRCGRMDTATRDTCLAAFEESCNGRYEPRYRELEAAGLLELSRDGVRACEEHLRTVPCEQQVFDLDGPCRGMWLGLQPTGGRCAFDIESLVCEPGAECVLGLDLCGECRPTADVGAPCGSEATCELDATCRDGACLARKRIGESCGETDVCVLGARCADGVCAGPAYVGAGEPCDQTHRCPYLTACVEGSCQPTSLVGGACDSDADCATGFCEQGACVALLASGAACSRSQQCAGGMCDANRCRAYPSACFQ